MIVENYLQTKQKLVSYQLKCPRNRSLSESYFLLLRVSVFLILNPSQVIDRSVGYNLTNIINAYYRLSCPVCSVSLRWGCRMPCVGDRQREMAREREKSLTTPLFRILILYPSPPTTYTTPQNPHTAVFNKFGRHLVWRC